MFILIVCCVDIKVTSLCSFLGGHRNTLNNLKSHSLCLYFCVQVTVLKMCSDFFHHLIFCQLVQISYRMWMYSDVINGSKIVLSSILISQNVPRRCDPQSHWWLLDSWRSLPWQQLCWLLLGFMSITDNSTSVTWAWSGLGELQSPWVTPHLQSHRLEVTRKSN